MPRSGALDSISLDFAILGIASLQSSRAVGLQGPTPTRNQVSRISSLSGSVQEVQISRNPGTPIEHLGEPIEYQLNTWASQSNTNGIMGAPSQCQSNTWARQSHIFIPGLLLLQNAGLQGLRVPKLEGFKIAGLAPVSSSAGSQILGLQHPKVTLVNFRVLHNSIILKVAGCQSSRTL